MLFSFPLVASIHCKINALVLPDFSEFWSESTFLVFRSSWSERTSQFWAYEEQLNGFLQWVFRVVGCDWEITTSLGKRTGLLTFSVSVFLYPYCPISSSTSFSQFHHCSPLPLRFFYNQAFPVLCDITLLLFLKKFSCSWLDVWLGCIAIPLICWFGSH